MNWINNMNNALEYIENNIEKDIKSEDVAKKAYSSKFHFLRIFNTLTGMTLGEYIRKRRLSLACKDLMTSDMKIIDISFKYGYETPEAFSKAFKKIHKVTPSKARKTGINLKAIPPISFQISIKGEKRMDYKIEKKKSFKIVGIKKRFTAVNGENFKNIPKFWDEVCSNGTLEKLQNNANELGVLGVCYDFDKELEEFSYMIAIEGKSIKDLENIEVVGIPECSWAVFESIGPMPHAIQKVTKKIFEEWFPATQYEHANAPELEVYLSGNPNDPDYRCEVWIPIIDK
ncbi:MAG: AraC family transcriptional regulator [Firmicutes bacterium]|nr:AraC family transcriptional regulator [Bacillota bacterium]